MKTLYKLKLTLLALLTVGVAFAGNPDRQGEAGASELLLNPWARSAGLHSMNTASITGIESMRLNIAGLSRLGGKEVAIAHTRLYEGSDVNINALGFGNKVGSNGAFGVTLTAMDFGDIPITDVENPEGTGGVFSPSFFNIGLGYSHMYDNKISVGILFRGVSESVSNASAFGFALDAGVQYVAGERDNFRLGISLRNVGSPMSFSGQGLAFQSDQNGVIITGSQRAAKFELPSALNIGISYDFYFGNSYDPEGNLLSQNVMLRALGNFTSNAFSRDQIGLGIEAVLGGKFTLRGGYKQEIGDVTGPVKENLYTGLAGGASVELPYNDDGSKRIAIDYAYRTTDPFKGTHNVSIRLLF